MAKSDQGAASPAAPKETIVNDHQRTQRIRDLNDQLRRTLLGGRVLITSGVQALGSDRIRRLLTTLRAFSKFTEDNDPHGEHDFGAFNDLGDHFFWKIDYYDPSLTAGSLDPADASKTGRVLTLMLASEY
jgi:hypothetical protein